MVGFFDFPLPMLLVVHEVAGVYASVFVEILALAVLFVFGPVANIEFSLLVVVFAFALLHAFEKVSLVPLGI